MPEQVLRLGIDPRGAVQGAAQWKQATDDVSRSAQGAAASTDILDAATKRIAKDVALAQRDFQQGKIALTDYTAAVRMARQEMNALQVRSGGASAISAAERELAALDTTVTRSHGGIGRLNNALFTMTRQATGISPVFSQAADAVGTFALGVTQMTAVIATITAVAVAYEHFTAATKAAREEQEKYLATLREVDRMAEPGKELADALAAQRTQLANLDRQRKQFRAAAGIAFGGEGSELQAAANRKAADDLDKQYETLARLVKDGEEEILTIRANAAKDSEKNEAAYWGKVADNAKKSADEQAAAAKKVVAALKEQREAMDAILRAQLRMLEVPSYSVEYRASTMRGGNLGGDRIGGVNTAGPGGLMHEYGAPPPASSYKGSGFNYGGAAYAAGTLLATGMAGSTVGGAASGALSGAAMGAMLGSVVPGVGTAVGAVVGAVGGLVKGLFDHGKKAKEAAELMKQAQTALDADIAARTAAASGNKELAEDIRRQTAAEKELAEARKAGMSAASLAALKEVQIQEALAVERERATAASDAAAEAEKKLADAREAAIQRSEDWAVRAARATGRGDLADTLALKYGARREMNDLIASGGTVQEQQQLGTLQWVEAQALQLEQWKNEQIAAINDAADAQIRELEEQNKTAATTLRVAEDQLRASEQSLRQLQQVVDSLGAFRDSLKLGGLTTLSPIDQLAEARRQFEALKTRALGGDATAAGGIPASAQALLEASRAVNASNTGYVRDYEAVLASVDQVQAQFADRATIEEAIYAELQRQTVKAQEMIETQRSQIDAVNAARDAQISVIISEFTETQNRLFDIVRGLLPIEQNTGQQLMAYLNEIQTLRITNANIINDYESRIAAKDSAYSQLLQQYIDAVNGGMNNVVRALERVGL